MNKRIAWMDTAKFLGIYLVFLFHAGENAGYMHAYSIQVCLHLFFLLSGCAESLGKNTSWKVCIVKNVRKLLIPYFLFAILAAAMNAIMHNTYTTVVSDALLILRGVPRNWFCAVSLWFLSCLFVIRLGFFALRKWLKKPAYMLAASLVLFVIGDYYVDRGHWLLSFFNIDNALYFMVFYVIGYCSFGLIRSVMELDTTRKKAIFFGLGGVLAGYTILVFFGKNPLYDLCSASRITRLLADLVHPLILAAFILVLAKLIEDLSFLQALGRESLFLCGSEFLTNMTLMTVIQYFSIMPNFANALSLYIYVMIVMTVAHRVFVPLEKAILNKLGC